jgi:rubrerythrin
MSNKIRRSTLEQVDEFIDATDGIECYQEGKIWECECGQDMWGYHHTEAKKCPTCNVVNIDRKPDSREAPDVEDGQMTLGNF